MTADKDKDDVVSPPLDPEQALKELLAADPDDQPAPAEHPVISEAEPGDLDA